MSSHPGQEPPHDRDEDLAYGDYHDPTRNTGRDEEDFEGEEGERGIIGDTYRKIRGKNRPQQDVASSQNDGAAASGLGSFLFNKLHGAVHDIGSELNQRLNNREDRHSHTPQTAQWEDGTNSDPNHRYGSFAPQRTNNDVKWFVDGCGYMWAVSMALERATHSIWILDWWLSPELYLRRPPSRNEGYRLDRMLQAAAARGVKVNIIVYKEVTQALTRKYLTPTIPKYLHSLLPSHTDPVSKSLTGLGLAATFASLEYLEKENPLMESPLTVSSSHTKHALEALHPNIAVFRHPDHLPDAQTLQSSFMSSLQNMSLTAKNAASLPADALKAIYGMNEDVILYWAHHEKLCIVDGETAFMGGLDLCYGRWDTNQHPIADCHPSNLDDIVFPGQDYNNARIMDFQDVAHWQNNKLNRKDSSRMGWSDISISLSGPVVEDLRTHFVQRWNFIYNEKYDVRKDTRYSRLSVSQIPQPSMQQAPSQTPSSGYKPYRPSASYQPQAQTQDYHQYPPPPPRPQDSPGRPVSNQPNVSNPIYEQGSSTFYSPDHSSGAQGQVSYYPPPQASRETGDGTGSGRGIDTQGSGPQRDWNTSRNHEHQILEEQARGLKNSVLDKFEDERQHVREQYSADNQHHGRLHGDAQNAGIPIQLVRSCTKWSHGVPTEHSIANAYISVIENSQHFVYIENQFFITATSDKQKPVTNKVGKAIVDRILRAARAGEKFKMIVLMPAVPAFAGDLRDDSSLGTRAIMEFQYNSINRGGYSIMECVANAGYNPMEYIRFYNLRNYDRINVSRSMQEAEHRSGIDYAIASREHDEAVELPAEVRAQPVPSSANYRRYNQTTGQMSREQDHYPGNWDSVSACYMAGGDDIRSVPWSDGEYSEIDAFVSEELYIHSKVLIADDRIVICGSANMNDRSQLGYHDSEIAVVIEDQNHIDSIMDGHPYRASRFAATLRRQLFRKHLGLLPSQDMEHPTQNFEPIGVPNTYDYNSPGDQLVADPLAHDFLNTWNSRAKANTDAFARVFHPVPHDSVRTWKDYESYYEHFFKSADKDAQEGEKKAPSKYMWGHVVAEEFAPGDQGVKQVKDVLSTIKGTLVEMPLSFLIEEDIAEEGVGLNAFTEEVYT